MTRTRSAVFLLISLAVVVLIVYALVPIGSQPVPSELKIRPIPPGYPVPGDKWTMQVLQHNSTYPNLVPAANATVIVHTTNFGNLSLTTNNAGEVEFTYDNTLGQLTVTASKPGFASAEFDPSGSYVSDQTAQQTYDFFGIGNLTTLLGLGTSLKNPVESTLRRRLIAFVLILWVIGSLMLAAWFVSRGSGSQYGYPNSIIDSVVLFNPHLLYVTAIFLTISVIFAALSTWQRLTGKLTPNPSKPKLNVKKT